MSACDSCPKPGACCKAFGLWDLGTFWVDEGNAPPQAALDSRRDSEDHPYPFKALAPVAANQYKDDDGRHFAHWVFTCPKLNAATGRCSDYDNRPDTCRDYEPESDGLCALSSNYGNWPVRYGVESPDENKPP